MLIFYTLLLGYTLIHLAGIHSWKTTVQLNPGCTSECHKFNLVYVSSRNETLSVHNLFSASERFTPSVLVAVSHNPNANLNIDWGRLKDPQQAITIEDVSQSYGIVFSRLVEYDDKNDSADMTHISDDPTTYRIHHMGNWSWKLANFSETHPKVLKDDEIFNVEFVANGTDDIFSKGGEVNLKFMISNGKQRGSLPPHLLFLPGLTTQFEMILNNLVTSLKHARFGVQMALISNNSIPDSMDFRRVAQYSIDDETTPGIFEMVNLLLNEQADQKSTVAPIRSYPPAFMQLRPVCYTASDERNIKSSRGAKIGLTQQRLNSSEQTLLSRSMPYTVFGDRMDPAEFPTKKGVNSVGIRLQNFSMGTPEDLFYENSKYLVWTGSYGIGEPPEETLSSLLIGLIIFCAVVMATAFLFGALLIIILKRRQRAIQFAVMPEPEESVDPKLA
ncbi:unnamed protein product [Calicophoron daubneyi]|uniref:Glycosylated lysosomal membrane protein n=1 Tax=Calicophoron daubneyi TaxID=300641 RepID=A0AAV2TJX9_CALDB